VTVTDETRFHHPPRVRWGVVCGDGEVVWARDEAAARRVLVSLVGAIRIVCEEAPAEDAEEAPTTVAGLLSSPVGTALHHPR
jgi:hypothetical protein